MRIDDTLDWFAAIDEAPVGPLAGPALRARFEAGQIGPDTLVWRPAMADWQPVRELPDLHDWLRAAAPRPAQAWTPALVPAAAPRSSMAANGSLAALASGELARAMPAAANGVTVPTNTVIAAAPHVQPQPQPPPAASPERRRPSGAGAMFVLGAALAGIVASFAFNREPRPQPPAPVAAAPVAPKPAAPEAAAPARVPSPEPAVAHAEVAPAAPVRVSDPPAAAETVAHPPAAAAAPRARPAPKAQPRVAARERAAKPARAEPPRPAKPAVKETRVAMAAPQEKPAAKASADELPSLPPGPQEKPAPAKKASGGDPLLDSVSDDDLERALGGGSKATKPASSAVYVPPAPGSGSDLPEQVSPAQINDAVAARVSSLRGCIEEQRAADPNAKGTMKLRWTIGGDGSVREVKSASPEFDGQPISKCLSGVVRAIKFPASRTKGQEVVFPFKF